MYLHHNPVNEIINVSIANIKSKDIKYTERIQILVKSRSKILSSEYSISEHAQERKTSTKWCSYLAPIFQIVPL